MRMQSAGGFGHSGRNFSSQQAASNSKSQAYFPPPLGDISMDQMSHLQAILG